MRKGELLGGTPGCKPHGRGAHPGRFMVQRCQVVHRALGARPLRWVACLAALLSAAPTVQAQSWPLSADEHPWASFPAGSWKVVVVTTKQFGDSGTLLETRSTRTETNLEWVEDNQCELKSRSTIDVERSDGSSAPTIASPAQAIKLPLRAGPVATTAKERRWATIGGQRIGVLVYESVTKTDGKTTRHTVWYSPRRAPYVMREHVEVRSADAESNGELIVEWDSQVTSLNTRVAVLDDRCRGWEIKAVRTTSRGTTTTIEVHCPEVPGTLVRSSTTQTNEAGRVVRQSVLELRSYGTAYSKRISRRDLRRARRRAHHRKRGR